jgi:hypothetical protein
MRSGVTRTRTLSALLFSIGASVLAVPASASVGNESSPWVEWGGDLVTRPLRLSTRPLVVEVAVRSSSISSDEFPARLVIEQVSPWRRAVLDAPMTVLPIASRRVHVHVARGFSSQFRPVDVESSGRSLALGGQEDSRIVVRERGETGSGRRDHRTSTSHPQHTRRRLV